MPARSGSWLDFLTGLIPSNILGLDEVAYNRVGDIDALDVEPGYRETAVPAE